VLYAGLAIVLCRFIRSPFWRAVVGVVGVLIPVAVAVSRVYRGMHHPTDVVAGLLLGVASLGVGIVAVRRAWSDDKASSAEVASQDASPLPAAVSLEAAG
jgi:membrane-associated phospholipid phosphatase